MKKQINYYSIVQQKEIKIIRGFLILNYNPTLLVVCIKIHFLTFHLLLFIYRHNLISLLIQAPLVII